MIAIAGEGDDRRSRPRRYRWESDEPGRERRGRVRGADPRALGRRCRHRDPAPPAHAGRSSCCDEQQVAAHRDAASSTPLAIVLALWVLLPIYFITLAAFSTAGGRLRVPAAAPAARHVDRHDAASSSTRRGSSRRSSAASGRDPHARDRARRSAIPAGYALARFAFRGADTFRLAIVEHARLPDRDPLDPARRSPSSAGGSTTRSSASRSRTPRSRCRSPCS